MLKRIAHLGCIVFGGICLAKAAYIPAKAFTAQILLDRSWSKMQMTGDIHLPWSWMDAYPAAKLHMPNKDTHIVLNTDSGQALAFGPALMSGSDLSGDKMIAIAAHKNTQFKTLQTLKRGDVIGLETPMANRINYKIERFEIIDSRISGLAMEPADSLALVTCYPFDAISFNGPMRFVVFAHKMT
ncbi:MAG: class GN sortase [Litorimonas sp.]